MVTLGILYVGWFIWQAVQDVTLNRLVVAGMLIVRLNPFLRLRGCGFSGIEPFVSSSSSADDFGQFLDFFFTLIADRFQYHQLLGFLQFR